MDNRMLDGATCPIWALQDDYFGMERTVLIKEGKLRYLCLVFFDEQKLDAMPEDEAQALYDASLAWDDSQRKSGHFVAAQALQSVHAATTVRVRSGRVSVTDGPFAETNEQIGGFILIEAQDLNEAIRLASTIPSAYLGGVEVRPIRTLTSSTADRVRSEHEHV